MKSVPVHLAAHSLSEQIDAVTRVEDTTMHDTCCEPIGNLTCTEKPATTECSLHDAEVENTVDEEVHETAVLIVSPSRQADEDSLEACSGSENIKVFEPAVVEAEADTAATSIEGEKLAMHQAVDADSMQEEQPADQTDAASFTSQLDAVQSSVSTGVAQKMQEESGEQHAHDTASVSKHAEEAELAPVVDNAPGTHELSVFGQTLHDSPDVVASASDPVENDGSNVHPQIADFQEANLSNNIDDGSSVVVDMGCNSEDIENGSAERLDSAVDVVDPQASKVISVELDREPKLADEVHAEDAYHVEDSSEIVQETNEPQSDWAVPSTSDNQADGLEKEQAHESVAGVLEQTVSTEGCSASEHALQSVEEEELARCLQTAEPCETKVFDPLQQNDEERLDQQQCTEERHAAATDVEQEHDRHKRLEPVSPVTVVESQASLHEDPEDNSDAVSAGSDACELDDDDDDDDDASLPKRMTCRSPEYDIPAPDDAPIQPGTDTSESIDDAALRCEDSSEIKVPPEVSLEGVTQAKQEETVSESYSAVAASECLSTAVSHDTTQAEKIEASKEKLQDDGHDGNIEHSDKETHGQPASVPDPSSTEESSGEEISIPSSPKSHEAGDDSSAQELREHFDHQEERDASR